MKKSCITLILFFTIVSAQALAENSDQIVRATDENAAVIPASEMEGATINPTPTPPQCKPQCNKYDEICVMTKDGNVCEKE